MMQAVCLEDWRAEGGIEGDRACIAVGGQAFALAGIWARPINQRNGI